MGMQDDTACGDQQIEDGVVGYQGAGTDIYDISDTCFDILERLVSEGSAGSRIQQEPFISDIALPRGPPRDITGIRNTFAFWADYTGALAPIGASMDDRLQGHEEIEGLVVELLEMVERNLRCLEKNCDGNLTFPNVESQQELSAINSALNRLNFLARAIREIAVGGREQDLLVFPSDEDRLFRQMTISYTKWKYARARSSLREHMGAAITTQRRCLIQKYQHANELKIRQEPNLRPWYSQETMGPLLSSIKISDSIMSTSEGAVQVQQSAAGTKATQASEMDERIGLEDIPDELMLSIHNSGSVQKEDFVSAEYPDPPQIELGETYAQCPYCLEQLPAAELLGAAGEEYWKQHVDQDIHPYICLFPRCTSSAFAQQSEWSNHMASVHSSQWPRKVHAMIWYCDLGHEEKFKFDNEADWKTHMQTLSLHPGYSKPPTETQLDALVVRKQHLALRDLYVCPFCEYIPQPIAALGDRGDPTDMEKRLINHIASHIKSFLLMALPAVNAKSMEGDRRAASPGSSLHRRRILSVPDITMDVDETIRTIQPLLSWDFTLPRGWLWDTAYDNLKVEMPDIIETYEDLLSRALITKTNAALPHAGEDSRVSNQFSQIDVVVRREKMKEIAHFALEHLEDEKASKTVLGHEIAAQEVVKDTGGLIRTAKEYIGNSIRDLPYTCIISAGVAIVIPLLVNAIATEAANQSAFIYIATQMRYYASMESLLLSNDLDDNTRIDLMERLANLYKLITSFQVRSVIRFYRSRTKNSLIKTDSTNDWDERLQDIKDNNLAIISSIEGVISESNLGQVEDILMTLRSLAQEADDSRAALEGQLRTAQESGEYRHTGASEFRQLLNNTPIDYPIRGPLFWSIGNSPYGILRGTQETAKVEGAIHRFRDPIMPRGHQEQAIFLTNVGNGLSDQYVRTGNINDLDMSIQIAISIIDIVPYDHPGRGMWLSDLGRKLTVRYLRTGEIANLEEAIQVTREATNITPHGNPNRAVFLYALATQLGYRYSLTRSMDDLEEVINFTQDVINFIPANYSNRAALLGRLGLQMFERYSRLGVIKDLDTAIRLGQEAVLSAPTDHPGRFELLNALGTQLGHRYSLTSEVDDLEKSRRCFAEVLFSFASGISVRIAAGCQLLQAPDILTNPHASRIASTTISLLPLLTPRSMEKLDKQHIVFRSIGMPSDAAAVAIHNNLGALAAIDFLETSCGLVRGAIIQQHDISSLAKIHPELARSFIDLHGSLDGPTLPSSDLPAEISHTAGQVEADQHREANQRLTLLLDRIRSIPGFERFLLPPSRAEMLDAARYGPIVVLNASRHRCDALIVRQSGFRSLHLPRVSNSAIDYHRRNLESTETLIWLWDDIVSPILDDLGFTRSPLERRLPRVWWVPMGKLSIFPLHAAGHHFSNRNETALDRVVSSYALSVNSIVHSRRKQHQVPVEEKPTSLVTVTTAETQSRFDLHVEREIYTVLTALGSKVTHHNRPAPYKSNVLSALRDCRIFHFAGSCNASPFEPLKSFLHLEDWMTERLTVESLLDANIDANAFLAYLSATDEGFISNGTHLANGFQLAGFRHVIGAFWVIEDAIRMDMAQKVYEFLRDEGLKDESVSRGLHHAMRELRDEWVHITRDAENAARGESEATEFIPQATVPRLPPRPHWIAFFHYGI